MTDTMPDDLWRDFPKTAPAFEARFKTEDDCRAYWIKARWGGEPACAKCHTRVDWHFAHAGLPHQRALLQ